MCLIYIMLYTYMHGSHNDALSTSDNTTQNTGTLLCFKQYHSFTKKIQQDAKV